MPKRPTASYAIERRVKRDLELCKVVFGATISQILFARRAFPPECFQLLPLEEVVSRSFEDIVASGSEIQDHDKELLRDQGSTLFLRQGMNYGLNRFLGILREDIFPLIETEGLVKFRVSYLRTKTWKENCLAEYYTVALKYENDGRYEVDIWRAGTGKQHVANTDSQLWNLGDYLSRLPSWTGLNPFFPLVPARLLTLTGAEPLHWTLAFHATERPDDPPIGVWKFDRTDFDDANLDLQQHEGYAYARITRLEIMPLSPTDIEDVIFETSPDPEPGSLVDHKSRTKPPMTAPLSQKAQGKEKRNRETTQRAKNSRKLSPRSRGAAAAQLSPPLTLTSSRNASKNATAENGGETEVAADNTGNGAPQRAEGTRNPASRKGLVTKRKPKRPLQLFEEAASSLPLTQIISQSQSLGQRTQVAKSDRRHGLGNNAAGQEWFTENVPHSPSPDPFTLLDGISLSPEAISATQTSPFVALPRLPTQFPTTQYHMRHAIPMDESRGLLRLGPSSSVVRGHCGMSQWEPRASPPANLLGIAISDDEENVETISEAGPETLPRPPIERDDAGISYSFSPDTVGRRTSQALFHDLPSSSDGEE
ncbi:hypothetical protein C8A01DRAFT_46953 [Parachaetomium inaequale]|uniref:HORMA domain-containing protein n=1 Tax=Parachaetomium inaequale TaxID=2588326 RepID=A0AAN6SR84_9PEZI|nr:hypothetical protein C8A01DRAFT_46953 [Parachaetomium inaequale]